MHIVTGAAGFIGSNLIRGLNASGITNILAVDDLTQGEKFRNLVDCQIADYMDRSEFREFVRRGRLENYAYAGAIYHQGACADTTEADGKYMMDNNYTYSQELLKGAIENRIPFVYASSAAVYGIAPEQERPLNVYGYSKLLFDQYAREGFANVKSTVVGLRYFNVYGPHEDHKGRMASIVHQLYHQINETGVARLFRGTDGYGDGEQRRDFIHVQDVVNVNLHFGLGEPRQGIFNVGTGTSRTFNDVAHTLSNTMRRGRIEYIPFPQSLIGKYQSCTQADLTRLREAGYTREMMTLEEGIRLFV